MILLANPRAQHKLRVRRRLRNGPAHPDTWSRFGDHARRVADFGFDLDAACTYAQSAYLAERAAFKALALAGRSRVRTVALDELRLILRWLRFKRQHRQFADLLRAITGDEFAAEATHAA